MNYNKSVWVDVFSEKDFRRYRKGRIVAKLINIGFGNVVNSDKIIAVVSPEAAPVKRMVQRAKESNRIIDATQGRRTKAVLITGEEFIILRLCSRKRSAADSTAAGKQKKSEGNLKMSRGILTVVSGFSGAGKGTLMKRLMEEYDNYALSISVTTRDPRPGEEDGVSYFFRTEEEFDRMVEEDAFLEYARYVKHSYGTPKAYVEEQLDAGKDVLLEIEIQGALQVKEKRPDTLLVFITPPTAEELERRLRGRGTETEEVIKGRMERAKEEAQGMDQYDYVLINDDLETCVKQMHETIQSQHFMSSNQKDFIEQMKKSLEK